MHRSGTSSLTRILNLLGVDLGRQLMLPADDNPKGFWESIQIVTGDIEILGAVGSYFDDILPRPEGWEKRPEVLPQRNRLMAFLRSEFAGKSLWGFKDPRACRMVRIWRSMFDELKTQPGYVLMVRHPEEVVASMVSRNGHSPNQSMLMTLTHMLEAERDTRGQPRVVVTFDQVMNDWRGAVERIGSALQIQWPRSPEAVAGPVGDFLDPSLWHHKRSDSPKAAPDSPKATTAASTAVAAASIARADPRFAQWVFSAYQLLAAAAAQKGEGGEGHGVVDEAGLDRVSDEFRQALPEIAAWRTLRSQKEKLVNLHLAATRADEHVKRVTRENEQLRQDAARWQAAVAAQSKLISGQAGGKAEDKSKTSGAGGFGGVDWFGTIKRSI
jgi:hypothetical protein